MHFTNEMFLNIDTKELDCDTRSMPNIGEGMKIGMALGL